MATYIVPSTGESVYDSRIEWPVKDFTVQYSSGNGHVDVVRVSAQTPIGAVRIAAQLRKGFDFRVKESG